MSYKRFSLRFNMDDADERRAWELLHSGDIAVINTEVIKRINDAERYKHLEWILRKVVSEELRSMPLTLSVGGTQSQRENEENENSPGRSFWTPALTVETTISLILKGPLRPRWFASAGTRTVSSWFIWTLTMGERSSLLRGRTPTIRGLRIFLLIPASELLSSIPRRAFLILEVPK